MPPADVVPVATPAHTERVRLVACKVRDLIASGKVDVSSAFEILKTAAAVGASWEVAEEALVELAKGADGLAGTSDDLIPEHTVEVIKFLLRNGVVHDIVSWATTAMGVARAPWWMLRGLSACASLPKTK